MFGCVLCHLVVAATLTAAVAAEPLATAPNPAPHTPIFTDVRSVDQDVRNNLRARLEQPLQIRRLLAGRELAKTIPGLSISYDDLFGSPRFIRSTRSLLTLPVKGAFNPDSVLQSFVTARPALFTITAAQLKSSRITRYARTPRTGVTTIWRQQQIKGVDLFGAELRGSVTPGGALISVSSTFVPEPVGGFRLQPAQLSRIDAIRAAARELGVRLTADPQPLTKAPDANRRLRFARTPELSLDVDTRVIAFPLTPDDIRPAYEIHIAPAPSGDMSVIIIDAANGRLLRRSSATWRAAAVPATYRVFTGDSPAPITPGPATPDGSQAATIARSLLSLISLDPVASPNGWIPDANNTTVGNNVDAHLDQNADNIPDLPRPIGAPFRTFDFTLDTAMDPSTFADAAVTQIFYTVNWFHDRLYGLGFTEPFGAYQSDNFGRGGVGADAVIADVQDGASTNNARFLTTGADGQIGRLEVFLWPNPTPTRDGALDQQVVMHELTHGLSVRLHGDLSRIQAAGLSEGWSDFYALALLADPADDPNGVYAIGSYVTFLGAPGFVTNAYFGIRRFPYANDLMKNPLTFADIDDAQFAVDPTIPRNPAFGDFLPSGVHAVGEVWCSMLWQCRANLIAANGPAGAETMLQLVTDAMKLSPSNPNFIEARDSILLADMVSSGGANQCALWAGFALRGLGLSATSPQSATVANVVEAFDVPLGVEFSYPGDPHNLPPDRINPAPPITITATIRSACGQPLLPTSPKLFLSINGGVFSPILMIQGAQSAYTAALPPLTCGEAVRYYLAADTTSATFTDPPQAPAQTFSLVVTTSSQPRFHDNGETDMGWTVTGNAIDGQWDRSVPIGGGARGDPPTDADGSGACFLTDNINNAINPNSDVDGGSTILTSPALDATGGEAFISYQRWFSNNFGAFPFEDTMRIELSPDNGATWTPLETVSENTNTWVFKVFRVSDFVLQTSQLRIRFIPSDLGGGSVVEAGVDAVDLVVVSCAAAPLADLNGDGAVGSADLAILLGSWGACPPAPAACPADLNGDGVIGSSDLAILLGSWG